MTTDERQRAYFTPNSADALLAQTLKTGDVLLLSKKCAAHATRHPATTALCYASKFGLSGDAAHSYDHAALVVTKDDVPYLLEGDAHAVTLRSYEERLMQSDDLRDVSLLRLHSDGTLDKARLRSFLHDELQLRKVADGFDAPPAQAGRCENLWSVYRAMRTLPRRERRRPPAADDGGGAAAAAASSAVEGRPPPCTFGAPLVATALQRLGALAADFEPSSVTPEQLEGLPLSAWARFRPRVAVRG
jgi:hypothetical protein